MALAFLVLFAGVMAAEYALLRRALAALRDLGLAGSALTLYAVEAGLALSLLVGVAGYVVSGLVVFYRGGDTRLLLAAPLSTGGLYSLRAVETFALTAWPIAVLGLPALLALGATHGRGTGALAAAALVLAGVTITAGALGACLTAVAGLLLRRAPSRLAAALALAVIGLAFALLVGRQIVPSTADFHAIFDPGMLNGKPASIKFIEARFRLWPSHPFAAELYALGTGGRAGSAATRTLVWLAPAGALAVAATLGRRLFATALPVVVERFVLGARLAGRGKARRGRPRWLRGPVGALVARDVRLFARNPSEWSRGAFLGLLLVLSLTFVLVAPVREVGDRPHAVARLALMTVATSGYFLTAFALRFTFPAISVEGRAAWLFFSSPVSPFRVALAKLGLHLTLLGATALPLAIAGVVRVAPSPPLAAALAVLLVLLVLATTTVLLVCGAAWPDFREPNPEALSTSAGGLLGTLACLVHVALVAWIARGAVLAGAGGRTPAPWLAGAAVLSMLLVAAALAWARRRLRALEAP